MKILYSTDWHITAKHPVNRTDEFLDVQFEKLQKMFDIAKKEKADRIICGGDIFDVWKTPNVIVQRLITLLRNNKVIVECIAGNHDIQGYLFDTFQHSSLGVIVASGFVKLISKDNPIFFPIHTRLKYDAETYKTIKQPIVVSHEYILTQPAPFDHAIYSDVPVPDNVKLVLCGHYHKAFNVKNKNGTIFLNPGSLTRQKIGDNFAPQCAIIDFNEKTLEVNIDNRLLTDVDYFDIFDLSQKEKKEVSIEISSNVLKDISDQGSIVEMVKTFAEDKKYSEEVVQETVKRVDVAVEKIGNLE